MCSVKLRFGKSCFSSQGAGTLAETAFCAFGHFCNHFTRFTFRVRDHKWANTGFRGRWVFLSLALGLLPEAWRALEHYMHPERPPGALLHATEAAAL